MFIPNFHKSILIKNSDPENSAKKYQYFYQNMAKWIFLFYLVDGPLRFNKFKNLPTALVSRTLALNQFCKSVADQVYKYETKLAKTKY